MELQSSRETLSEVSSQASALISRQKPTRFGMLTQFSLFIRLVFARIYAHVVHEPSQIQDILAIPQNEPIIYLLSSENKHDYLFLNHLCLKTGMPIAFISNGGNKLKYSTIGRRFVGLFTRKKKPTVEELSQLVQASKPMLLFLNQYGIREQQNAAKTEEILEAIRKIALDNPELKIHLVPVGIIWERRAESYRHSLINEIFGTPTRPSSIRRFVSVLPGMLQLFLQIGQPLCLMHHHVLKAEDFSNGGNLRRFLCDDISMMHTQVNGPKVKPHQQLLREIIESEEFQNELTELEKTTQKSHQELEKEAKKILNKSASKFSLLACKMFCTFMTPMWSMIYNGLYYDTEKFNEIRELSKTHRLVFIPSHKSHIDYLVLSILLFQHGVLPPHIAAGDNLNFSFIGGILRRGGAFFIKRSFRGEFLYSACIRHYISKVLHEGFPVEFFIEGGRSRTGLVLQPKYGMLRMVAQTIQSDPDLPVKIIPCAITYEKVIEDMAYKKEQDGAVKQKENLSNLIRTTKLLISKYGQIYVSFADPIDMNECLQVTPEQSEETFTANLDEMTTELMDRINRVSTITTSSLLSCTLLNEEKLPISFDELLENAAFFLALLIERDALISPVLKTALAASRASLHLPLNSEEIPAIPAMDASLNLNLSYLKAPLHDPMLETLKIFKLRVQEDQTVNIEDSNRLQMTFYKNILLYSLIDDIYMACAIFSIEESERNIENIQNRFKEIADLFSIECSSAHAEDRCRETIEKLCRRFWFIQKEGFISIAEPAENAFRKLSHCIKSQVQSYLTVYQYAAQLNEVIEEPKLIQNLLNDSKQLVSDHKILPEARSKVFFSHAVQKLQSLNLFEVSYKQNGKKSIKELHKIQEISEDCMKLLENLANL